jgi:mitotic spindle assembly checkpoint protein MAD2
VKSPHTTDTHTQTIAPPPDWLEKGLLQRLVLVVTSAYSNEVLERWTFEVQTDKDVVAGG